MDSELYFSIDSEKKVFGSESIPKFPESPIPTVCMCVILLSTHWLDSLPDSTHNCNLKNHMASSSFICSTRLRVASLAEGVAVPLMQCPDYQYNWYSFCQPKEDDRLSQPHLVLIQQNTGAQTQNPKIPSQPP